MSRMETASTLTSGLRSALDLQPSSELEVQLDGSAMQQRLVSFSATCDPSISWGRHHHGSWVHSLGCASIMAFSPSIVIFYCIALSQFQGSIYAAYQELLHLGLVNFAWQYTPGPSHHAHVGYAAWLLFQAALYQSLPSTLRSGQLTPAGNLLMYRVNGLLAWAVTHGLFLAASITGYLDPAILAKNWEGLLVSVNIYGFLLSGFAYWKALNFPTHASDRKFSGRFPGYRSML